VCGADPQQSLLQVLSEWCSLIILRFIESINQGRKK
jgi:hypothetical protein